MNTPSLNLLRCPRRAYALEPGQLRAVLTAVVTGLVLGSAWGLWQQMQRDQLLDLRAQLQTHWKNLRDQQTRDAAAQEMAKLQTQWIQRAQSWQQQRQHLMQLHAALMAQAQETGLRVERWQGDGRQLLVQGWLPRAGSVPAVLSGLSQAWAPGWTLQSMGERAGAGVDVVLQAPWPAGMRDQGSHKP